MRPATILLVVAALLFPLASLGHEVRPAYLDLREEREGEFDVLWKTPMLGEMRLALSPVFSGETRNMSPPSVRLTDGAAVQTWRLQAAALRGQIVRIDGLDGTLTDALVRIAFADGSSWVHRLTPREPQSQIPTRQGAFEVAGAYLALGVEHILLGIDHLLFVLALLFLSSGTWRLIKAVTAFTAAHSITLGLATIGIVYVPSKPVEALIALSIVYLAYEIVHAHGGRTSTAREMPWIVAFTFGLLHGFGFAGALSEVGLPQEHIPVALLFFNLGVEAGQLLFIAAALAVIALGRRIVPAGPRWLRMVPPYAIGTMGSFWVIQRVAAF